MEIKIFKKVHIDEIEATLLNWMRLYPHRRIQSLSQSQADDHDHVHMTILHRRKEHRSSGHGSRGFF